MELWIEITDATGTRRHQLGAAVTRIGAGDAEVTVAVAGRDQLHVTRDPLHVLFLGEGAPPFCGGAPFRERMCAPGEVVEWAGSRIRFTNDASLEEVATPAPAFVTPPTLETPAPGASIGTAAPADAGSSTSHATDDPAWTRVRAGIYVDLGLADKKTVKRWQENVIAGSFSADDCARDIVASARPDDHGRVADRAGRLMRDFLMASTLKGVSGASRAVRSTTKKGIAFFIAQATALVVYSVIVLLCMLFLRIRGVSFDGFYDSILDLFRGLTGSA